MSSIYRPLAASFVILLLSSFLATAFAATAINLGTAGKFAVLARSEITLGSSATVNGDVGLSPGRSYSLDFPVLHLPLTGFGTSSLINGKVFASDYLGSVAILAQAASDSSAAFNAAFAQASSASDTSKMTLGAGALSGSYTPGLYNSASDITFKEITLVGGANDVFIFRTSGSISCSSSAKVILSGGVQTKNVFWIANEDITVASKAVFQGIMLSRGDISLGASAVVTGNAYAQGSISISSK
uniref:Antifreeze protein n=1 Tax=Glaciozyma antarctica TaxID=105987 RepID=M1K413_9BASI|nr:antifreeze protein [Glaciozyma antarctica]